LATAGVEFATFAGRCVSRSGVIGGIGIERRGGTPADPTGHALSRH
jgi:hypothetical protein